MSYKKTIAVLFLVSLFAVVATFVLDGDSLNLCGEKQAFVMSEVDRCVDTMNNVVEPIFFAFLPILVIFPILFFLRREVFIAWAKFATVAFPLMLGIMLYTYNDAPMRSGFGLSGLISNEQFATAILPPLFFLVSLII